MHLVSDKEKGGQSRDGMIQKNHSTSVARTAFRTKSRDSLLCIVCILV